MGMFLGARSAFRAYEPEPDERSFTSGVIGWFDKDVLGVWFTFGEPPSTEDELADARARRADAEGGE